MGVFMDKEKIMDLYAQHVPPSKVEMYKKYDIALVPHKRRGVYLYDISVGNGLLTAIAMVVFLI